MKTECAYCGKQINVPDGTESNIFCDRDCFELYQDDEVFNFDSELENLDCIERMNKLGAEIEKLCSSLTC